MASGFVEVAVWRMLEDSGHVRGNGVGPGITVIAGVVVHQMSKVGDEGRLWRERKEHVAQDSIRERQGLFRIVVVNLRVERQVHQAERKLAAIAGAFGEIGRASGRE